MVKQNFVLALAYNFIAIPLTVASHVTPLIAAIAMSSSFLGVRFGTSSYGRRAFRLKKKSNNLLFYEHFMAIRDLLLEESKQAVRARYGISRDTLWRWICNY